ncbi:hypothetical protein GYMLUDRAFT_65478 [Collybiopsis luxurians FD-317 M1]|uniref:Uncharacterized protein n=1 Tax=Collybiopsis luxurians FD-317 M1 TaxID=944289 RepID=A0A0D0B7A0_9AGAR|nr:hypothetical protein GYMLUDRAFT_65478 [Collybiopsis luxurians FD-317 M1]
MVQPDFHVLYVWQPLCPLINPEDYVDENNGEPITFRMAEGVTEVPYDFDEFKHKIDMRSRYMTTSPALDESDFEDDLQEIIDKEHMFEFKCDKLYEDKGMNMSVFHKTLLPEEGSQFNEENPYSLNHCSEAGNKIDNHLPSIKEWHLDLDTDKILDWSEKEVTSFIRKAKKFFVNEKGRLYHWRPDDESQPQLVVNCNK